MLRRCLDRVPVGPKFKLMVAISVQNQRLRESEVIPRRSKSRGPTKLMNTIWAIQDQTDVSIFGRCATEDLLYRYASRRGALWRFRTEPMLSPMEEIRAVLPMNRPRSADRAEQRNYKFLKNRLTKLLDECHEIPPARYWDSPDTYGSRTPTSVFVSDTEGPWEWRGERDSVSPKRTRPGTADYEGDVEELCLANFSRMCSSLTPRTDTTCPRSSSTIRNFPQIPFSSKTRHLLKLRKDLGKINMALKLRPMKHLPWKRHVRSKSLCDLRPFNLDDDCVSFGPSLHSLYDSRIERGRIASYTDVRLNPRKHFRDDCYDYYDDDESTSTYVIDIKPPKNLFDSFYFENFVEELPVLHGITNGMLLAHDSDYDGPLVMDSEDISRMYDADLKAFERRRVCVEKYGHDQPLLDRARRLRCKMQRSVERMERTLERCRTRCVARPATPMRRRSQDKPPQTIAVSHQPQTPAVSHQQQQDNRSRFSRFCNLFRRSARVHPSQEEIASAQPRDERRSRRKSRSTTNARRKSQDRPPKRRTWKRRFSRFFDSVKLLCGGEELRRRYEQRMRRQQSRHRREMQLRRPSSAPTTSYEDEEIKKTKRANRRSNRVHPMQDEQPKRERTGFSRFLCCFGAGAGGVDVVDRR